LLICGLPVLLRIVECRLAGDIHVPVNEKTWPSSVWGLRLSSWRPAHAASEAAATSWSAESATGTAEATSATSAESPARPAEATTGPTEATAGSAEAAAVEPAVEAILLLLLAGPAHDGVDGKLDLLRIDAAQRHELHAADRAFRRLLHAIDHDLDFGIK
jgi:hypothetical protein